MYLFALLSFFVTASLSVCPFNIFTKIDPLTIRKISNNRNEVWSVKKCDFKESHLLYSIQFCAENNCGPPMQIHSKDTPKILSRICAREVLNIFLSHQFFERGQLWNQMMRAKSFLKCLVSSQFVLEIVSLKKCRPWRWWWWCRHTTNSKNKIASDNRYWWRKKWEEKCRIQWGIDFILLYSLFVGLSEDCGKFNKF